MLNRIRRLPRLIWILAKRLTLAGFRNSKSLVAFASFCTFTVGWYQIWPPLAFLIPSTLVFGCLTWQHLRQSR